MTCSSITLRLPLPVFTQTPILQALQHVQASCDEAHKMRCSHAKLMISMMSRPFMVTNAFHITSSPCRFSDLFALAEEYEDSQSKPPKSRRKAPASSPRSRKGVAPPTNNEEESGSSSASVHILATCFFNINSALDNLTLCLIK